MACKEETRTPADLPPDLPTHSLPSNLSFPMLVPSSISSLNEPRPPDGRPYSPPTRYRSPLVALRPRRREPFLVCNGDNFAEFSLPVQ